jgi:hypothetical protein
VVPVRPASNFSVDDRIKLTLTVISYRPSPKSRVLTPTDLPPIVLCLARASGGQAASFTDEKPVEMPFLPRAHGVRIESERDEHQYWIGHVRM